MYPMMGKVNPSSWKGDTTMASRDEHLASGLLVGSAVAGAGPRKSWQNRLGILAGAAGGSLLPDMFDPPSSPVHRDSGHSLVLLGAIASLGASGSTQLAKRQAELRKEARAYLARGGSLPGDLQLSIMVFEFLQGCVRGVAVGMATHLGMDALTPDGIRLLNRSL